MYGESCCYDYCDSNPQNRSQFCIRNRTDCLNNKYKPTRPSCMSQGEQTDGYYYFSPPAACTSGSQQFTPISLPIYVLVISVPTLVNLSAAMLSMISSSLLIFSMLKLQLKSILKSLLSCLLNCSPCLLLLSTSLLTSWLRLLFVSCLTFVINCLFSLLRIATALSIVTGVLLYPKLKCLNIIKPMRVYYCGILLNVSFNSIVRTMHKLKQFLSLIRCLPRNFHKFTFLLFTLTVYYNFQILKSLKLLTPLKFSMVQFRTDAPHREVVVLSNILHEEYSKLILTNVKSNLLLNNNLVVVLIKLFLKVINFLLEIAVIILLKLCYNLSSLCLSKIKLKKLYEKQFVINLLLYLINLSQHYCFLSSNFKYYYYDYYLLNIALSLLLLCRYNYPLLFTMNIFVIEYDYSFR